MPVNRPAANGTDRVLTILVVASMIYILLLGWGLLFGPVSFRLAYLLMVPPCLAPLIWCAYGFLKGSDTEQDFGLLISALGWGFIAISLLVKHAALNRDLEANPPVLPPGQSSAFTICVLFGVLAILSGTILSAKAWSRSQRDNTF
jgi:cytochrome b subunit of formate dehydrogenase